MKITAKTSLFLVLAALATACAGSATDGAPAAGADGEEEQDLTEAPYLEVVKTNDAQGTTIVAHGLPAVTRASNPAGDLEEAAFLQEQRASVPGYVGFSFQMRSGMGSFTGSSLPLLTVDTKTSPPTVTVHQNFIDLANSQLKEGRWSRLVEHDAANNSVATSFGWKVTYEPKASSYPKLHVERYGRDVLTKGASYWDDYAYGPEGCSYTPELAAAAISTQHKALLLRVHYVTTPGCEIADNRFTEELP